MKKYLLLCLLLVANALSFAQTSYQYVIVPTQFPSIGDGFNPYGISSGIQKILNEKSIKNIFITPEDPLDICDALTVSLDNTSNMFKNKLRVNLIDCKGKTIWTGEGVGISKSYEKGFYEAFADALKDMGKLPINTTNINYRPVTEKKITPSASPVKETNTKSTPEIKQEQTDAIYKPVNPFYNYTYLADLVEGSNGIKKLILINGELLGYSNLQSIATLIPSGLENVFTVQWSNTDGTIISGVANLTESGLKISLSLNGKPVLIILQKLTSS